MPSMLAVVGGVAAMVTCGNVHFLIFVLQVSCYFSLSLSLFLSFLSLFLFFLSLFLSLLSFFSFSLSLLSLGDGRE